jgi:predicted Zn-dependent peptidase
MHKTLFGFLLRSATQEKAGGTLQAPLQGGILKKAAAIVILFAALIAIGATVPQKVTFTDTTLPNGLRVIISEDHYAQIYAICISYKVGSRNEAKGRTGFAHLFEHMMFKGSENVGMGELDYLIYTNGGNMNGTTNTDRTQYYEALPKNQLDLGLFLEADRMKGLVITAENLENQRQAVKEERRQSGDNQAYGQVSEKMEELVYDNFPYHHSVIGSMADLDAASVDDVKQFFKTYYAPNNAVLAIAGDVDTKETLAKVKKYFGTIPRQPAPKPVDLAEPPKTAERRAKLDDKLARLPRVDIAWRIPAAGEPDARALAIAAQILGGGGGGGGRGGRGGGGGGNNSRLYLKLVEESQVASQANARTDRRAGPGTFAISVTLMPGKTTAEAEKLVYEEIARLQAEPVTEKELQRVRTAQIRQAASRFSMLQRAQQLADDAALYNDPDRINTEIDKNLAITAADIQKAAKTYLQTSNRVVVETTPAGK